MAQYNKFNKFDRNKSVFNEKGSKPAPESFIVRGRVVTNAGVAAKGLKVIAVDKSQSKEIVLGETITDSSGNYTISYKKEALQKLGKQKADIEIKILDPEEESKNYGTSSVHLNADQEEEINLVLQIKSVEKRSEYIRITSDLQPKIGEVAFKELKENKERQDISYLANKTGWDARLVAMVSLADKYSAASGIPAGFYFALFRAGISTDADAMYRTNSGTVKGDSTVKKDVYQFLQDGKFEIDIHPVEKFIEDNNIELEEGALNELKRLQRVYQVSPSDNAMTVLCNNKLDSALTIVQYDEKAFIETFGPDLGAVLCKRGEIKGGS